MSELSIILSFHSLGSATSFVMVEQHGYFSYTDQKLGY